MEPRSASRGMTLNVGRIEIDLPRSLGYFGAVAAALAFGVIEPPLGGQAEGTVRLRDPDQEAAEQVAIARSARRGEEIEEATTRARRVRGAPVPA
ncbi:hypothetical protein Drose_19180 [Dactylosporangium roseum]|uniref:Uncharacterized protein n=1 Tax=Dactylosporangium roseum TaxID=47989 RepID=A0ABY5YUQ0_9ACTN|nr:hypothetical protein [Dactylosporangium roseum]UWZ33446.1 hypothetical protein Drose_19180 [Dactylosporangium roseum]